MYFKKRREKKHNYVKMLVGAVGKMKKKMCEIQIKPKY